MAQQYDFLLVYFYSDIVLLITESNVINSHQDSFAGWH